MLLNMYRKTRSFVLTTMPRAVRRLAAIERLGVGWLHSSGAQSSKSALIMSTRRQRKSASQVKHRIRYPLRSFAALAFARNQHDSASNGSLDSLAIDRWPMRLEKKHCKLCVILERALIHRVL